MRWTSDDRIAVAIIVMVTCVCYAPVLWGGAVALPLNVVAQIAPWSYSYERPGFVGHTLLSDLVTKYYPYRLFMAREFWAGQIPLWNPYVFAGTPFLAVANSSVLYPVNWVFALLPTAYAFGVVAWFHSTLTAVASWMLGRMSGVRAYPALLVAIVAFGNGFVAKWVSIPDIGGAIAWAPVALVGALHVTNAVGTGDVTRQWRAVLLFVGANVMAWLAQPDTSFFITVVSGCTIIAATWQLHRERMRTTLIWTAVSALLFVGLFLPQLLPTLELTSSMLRRVSGGNTSGFMTFIFPEVFTNWHQPGDWGVQGNKAVAEHYIGLIPLGLFVWGMWRGAGQMMRLWAGVAVLVWLFSFSAPAMWQWMPIVSQFNELTRCLVVGLIAMGVVAARALDDVLMHGHARREYDGWLRGWAVVWTLFVLAGIVWMRRSDPDIFWQALRSWQGVGGVIAISSVVAGVLLWRVSIPFKKWVMVLLLLVAAGDVWWYWAPMQTFQSPHTMYRPTPDLQREVQPRSDDDPIVPPTRMSQFLRSQSGVFRVFSADYPFYQSNTGMVAEFQDIRGFESLMWGSYAQFVRRWEGKQHDEPIGVSVYITGASATPQWLDLVNVRFVLFKPKSPNIDAYPGLRLVHQSDEGSIYENLDVLPRAYIVHRVEYFADANRAYERLRDPQFPLRQAVTTTDVVPELAVPGADVAADADIPTITSYTANEVRITATVQSRAVLVLTDTHYPGWHVSVNGVEQPIYTVNGVFRGVLLDAGTNDVRFWYWPQSFAIGIWVAGATMVLCLLVTIVLGLRERTRQV